MSSLIPWLAVAAIIVLAVAGWLYGRRLVKGLQKVRAAAVERYGLTDNAPKGLYPDLEGTVDGHRVRVDVVQLAYRSSADSTTKRPWTRVRVDLREATQLVVAPQSSPTGSIHDATPTGDTAFDQAFVVTGSNGAVEGRLGATQRQAWLASTVPLRLDNRVLTWMHLKHVRDPTVLLGAIEECLRVARTMDAEAATT